MGRDYFGRHIHYFFFNRWCDWYWKGQSNEEFLKFIIVIISIIDIDIIVRKAFV